MGYPIKKALLGVMVATSFGLAQGPGKKDFSRPTQAEVRLDNGSVIRVSILQESLDVMTKYGKLVIPLRDIRRIDFGLHLPEGVEQQIQLAIQQMGSDVYKEREDAAKELLTLSAQAYPSLQRAARSSDLEVAQRALTVMKRICEKVPQDELRTKEEDVLHTAEFPVIGRIMSPTIRVHTVYFGEWSLSLANLRSVHMRAASADNDLAIDATKFGSALDQWFDTEMVVDPSLRLVITGDGQVDLWPQGPGQYVTGPKGYTTAGKGGQYMAGALLGRVGHSGKVFFIGDRFEGVPGEEGKLFLHIVPSPWNNGSTGSYRVRVRTDHVALSAPR